jgi:hypothetical protein
LNHKAFFARLVNLKITLEVKQHPNGYFIVGEDHDIDNRLYFDGYYTDKEHVRKLVLDLAQKYGLAYDVHVLDQEPVKVVKKRKKVRK